MLLALKVAGVFVVLFAAGLVTSLAEKKFQYSLWDSTVALPSVIKAKVAALIAKIKAMF